MMVVFVITDCNSRLAGKKLDFPSSYYVVALTISKRVIRFFYLPLRLFYCLRLQYNCFRPVLSIARLHDCFLVY